MVSNGKHVAVLARKLVNDAVLAGVEILELVDENGLPLRTNQGGCGSVDLEKLGGLDDEHVEVNEISVGKELLIIGKERAVIRLQIEIAEAMRGEIREQPAVPGFRAFEAGEDIHTRTASALFGVFPEMVSPDMRRRAKVINFGVIYGMSPFGLSKELGIGQAEAKEYIDNYFDRYRGVRRFLDEILENARRDKYVCTLLNRRRYIPEIASSNATIRQFAERTAINAPIQGTAADLIKVAMINLHTLLKERHPKANMIMQVHDELVIEAPEAEKGDIMALVKREMEGVVKLRVPLKVEINAGKNWDEAH